MDDRLRFAGHLCAERSSLHEARLTLRELPITENSL